MQNINELSYKDLKNYCSTSKFNFETTAELEPTDKGIGQERRNCCSRIWLKCRC